MIVKKIVKIIAIRIRCHILRLQCAKSDSADIMMGKLTALPRPLAGLKGKEGEWSEGKEKGKRERE